MSTPTPYLVAVLGVLGIGAASIVTLEIARPEGYNAQAAYTIVGMLTTVLTVLLAILKSVANGQATEVAIQRINHVAGTADRAAVAAATAPVVAAQAVREEIARTLPRGPIVADVTLHGDVAPKAEGESPP